MNKAIREFLEGYFSTNDRREKTRRAYISDLAQFEVFARKTTSISSIKNTNIENWVAHLKNKGYAPASIRRKIVVLKVFFTYWVRRDVIAESPFWRVKISFGRIEQLPRALTRQEIRDLLAQAQKNYSAYSRNTSNKKTNTSSRRYLVLRNVALLELLFATGIRVGEISAIDLSDYVPTEAAFKIQGKGGRERLAFVVDKVTLKIQREYLKMRQKISTESSAFFLNARGKRLSPQGIANVINRIREDRGIERPITPHMLRHTVATLLLRNGVDIRVVQEFLGHASIATTQRYTHIAKEHMIQELQSRHPSLALR
ncbi:MAG TPA: tyrosine-type recombinase/integrase [Pyrinomonadaceae bacterium]|jgi:integrase/recombinase XerD|nr:tyrosine-type recombinase/integrase [Pyrinomonadaceae bacterium]